MNKVKFPLAKDTIENDDVDALIEWLKTYPKLTKGEQTDLFEKELAEWTKRKHAVFVNSGSSANLLMAFALKWKCDKQPRKEKIVIVPEVGWSTSIAPFIQAGFDLVMCPTDFKTFGMDLEKLELLCQKHKPVGVIFVQPLGVLINKEKLLDLRKRYDFILMEDACGSVGSVYADGTKAGAIGDMSSWSMFFGHQISSGGEGGAIFTDDEQLWEVLIMLRAHGWLRDLPEKTQKSYYESMKIDDFNKPFTFIIPGFNVRNTDIAAFVGRHQLKKLDRFAKIRNDNHRHYIDLLNKFKTQKINEKEIISSISFAFITKDSTSRKNIIDVLNNNGIENRLYSAGALFRQTFWKDFVVNVKNEDPEKANRLGYEVFIDYNHKENDKFSLSNAIVGGSSNEIHDHGLFVPNTQEMTLDDVDFICDVILGKK